MANQSIAAALAGCAWRPVGGRRNTIKCVDAPVAGNQRHTLRAEFMAKRIRVSLDGRQHIEVKDGRFVGPGAVGVWTKADSVTAFDDFSYGKATAK